MTHHTFGGADGAEFGYILLDAYHAWKITEPGTGLGESVTEEILAELPADDIYETLTNYYTVYGNRVSTHYNGCYERHPLCLTRLLLDNAPENKKPNNG